MDFAHLHIQCKQSRKLRCLHRPSSGRAYQRIGARYYDADIGLWTSVDPMRQCASPYVYAGNNYNPLNSVDPDGRENTKVVAGGDGLVINGVGYSTAVVNEGYGPNSIRADYHPAAVNTEWANAAIDVTWTAWSTALSVPAAGTTGALPRLVNALDALDLSLSTISAYSENDDASGFAKKMAWMAVGEGFGRFWRLGQGEDVGLAGNTVLEFMGEAHQQVFNSQVEKLDGGSK